MILKSFRKIIFKLTHTNKKKKTQQVMIFFKKKKKPTNQFEFFGINST